MLEGFPLELEGGSIGGLGKALFSAIWMMMERDPRRFGSITFMVYYMIDIRLGLTACWWLLAIRSAAPLNIFFKNLTKLEGSSCAAAST